MGTKKMSVGQVILLSGALLAYLVGSGWASGQETVQYFTSSGLWCFVPGVLNIIMLYFGYTAYGYAGRTRGIDSLSGVFEFYVGKYIGKLFVIFAWLFTFCAYVFMIAGFGATLEQQIGLPTAVGSALGSVLAIVTALFGLNGIVNVIGKIGPVIVTIITFIGVVSIFMFAPYITQGAALLASGEVTVPVAGGGHPLTAGLSFGGCSLLLCSAYVARQAHDLREYKWSNFKLIVLIGAVVDSVVPIMIGYAHLGNIQNSANAEIPNLILANHIFPGLGIILSIVILLAIYSTICPLMWSTISTFFKDEKSAKYKIACCIFAVAVYIVTLFVPYSTLLNYIMTYCGYSGAIVFAACVIRYFMIRSADKKSGKVTEAVVAIEES